MLLLCSTLGDESCRPLSYAHFRALSKRVRALGSGRGDFQQELTEAELRRLGCPPEEAAHVYALLSREAQLAAYLADGEQQGIFPLTRISAGYPAALRQRLGDRCPPVLWTKGERAFLTRPCVSVVGSRQPNAKSLRFAQRCGALAARENVVLCTGGASGVDAAAEDACLSAGGCTIVFPAGRLTDCPADARVLFLAETGYDIPFSPHRALSRNRLIHAMGRAVFAAQPRLGTGGTWRGCEENLRRQISPVFVFDDGSEAASALAGRGATLTGLPEQLFPPEAQLRLPGV